MATLIRNLSDEVADYRTLLRAVAFVGCNILLPQLFHLAGLGGDVWVPILFFTLLASLRYGTLCSLAVAVFSPLASHLLTGMPGEPALWALMAKGTAMSMAALWLVGRSGPVRLWQVATVALLAQGAGMLFQALLFGGWAPAWAAVWRSVPGIVLQIGLVWAICRIPRRA